MSSSGQLGDTQGNMADTAPSAMHCGDQSKKSDEKDEKKTKYKTEENTKEKTGQKAGENTEDTTKNNTPEFNLFGKLTELVATFAQNLKIEVSPNGISVGIGGSSSPAARNVGATRGQGFNPDPNSIVDFMRARGMDSSLATRERLAAQRGINAGPTGTPAQNMALLNSLRQGK